MDTRISCSLNEWEERWQSSNTNWHSVKVNQDLLKHEKTLLPSKARVFVPLCGKTVDMKYLAENGHEVVGLEFAEKAWKDFFAENSLTFSMTKDSKLPLKVYKANELAITLYQGDMFDVSAEILGEFDAVWDTSSFVAINTSDRSKYAQILRSLLRKNGKILLNVFTYDENQFGGNPHTIEREVVHKIFGPDFKIKFLDKYDYLKEHFKSKGITEMFAINYLLSKTE